jgi:hypothetical protein
MSEITVVPWGLCPRCVTEFMEARLVSKVQQLEDGSTFFTAYCAHREVGASLWRRPDRPEQWKLVSPIDAVDWEAYIDKQVAIRRGLVAKNINLDS